LLDYERGLEYDYLVPVLIEDVDEKRIPELLRQRVIDLRRDRWDKGMASLIARLTQMITDRPKRAPRVFIIHGHDEWAKEAVRGLVQELGYEPVILNEIPPQGIKAIWDKLREHAGVDVAVGLLTPDEVVRSSEKERTVETPRARQNVIFELGLFVGLLGAKRVWTLRRGNTEIPSDLLGHEYIEMEPGGPWREKLATVLRPVKDRISV
jgi:predicted nucleotide-binding protein